MENLASKKQTRELESFLQIGMQEVRSWDFRASVSLIADNDYSLWLRTTYKDKDSRRMPLKSVMAGEQISEDVSQRTDQKRSRPQSSKVYIKKTGPRIPKTKTRRHQEATKTKLSPIPQAFRAILVRLIRSLQAQVSGHALGNQDRP